MFPAQHAARSPTPLFHPSDARPPAGGHFPFPCFGDARTSARVHEGRAFSPCNAVLWRFHVRFSRLPWSGLPRTRHPYPRRVERRPRRHRRLRGQRAPPPKTSAVSSAVPATLRKSRRPATPNGRSAAARPASTAPRPKKSLPKPARPDPARRWCCSPPTSSAPAATNSAPNSWAIFSPRCPK